MKKSVRKKEGEAESLDFQGFKNSLWKHSTFRHHWVHHQLALPKVGYKPSRRLEFLGVMLTVHHVKSLRKCCPLTNHLSHFFPFRAKFLIELFNTCCFHLCTFHATLLLKFLYSHSSPSPDNTFSNSQQVLSVPL